MMGYDTARFELYPPGWTNATERDDEGINISFAVPDTAGNSSPVSRTRLAAWLEQQGFADPEADATVFVRGDVEVTLAARDDELMEVLLQFSLRRTTPPLDA